MQVNIKVIVSTFFLVSALCKTKVVEGQKQKLLECWHCSSDTYDSEDFCNVVFQENNIPMDLLKERNIQVVRSCNSTINSEHERPVCRKTIEEANGKTITKRFCYYTNKSDPLDHCANQPSKKNVRQVFCQDCLTDKCNSAAKISTLFAAIVLPVFIAKIFSA